MSERPWYTISAKAEEADLYIYDEIGAGFFEEGVTARALVAELAALEVASIALHINSPGGSVFEGQAIFNAIRSHPARVTTYIDGVAASIASVVALAGDRVVMAANALFMIHDPFAAVIGTAADMRHMAEVLDQVTGTIRRTYLAKTRMAEDALARAMGEETWYGAREALEAGFVDEVREPLALAAGGVRVFDLSRFKRPPARSLVTPAVQPQKSTPEPAARAEASVPAAEAHRATDLVLVGSELLSFRRQ